MLAGLESCQERRQQQRVGEARGCGRRRAPTAAATGRASRSSRRPRRSPRRARRARARPVRLGKRAGDEVGGGDGVLVDERLLLRGERCRRLGVAAAVDDDRQPALGDPRRDLDVELERRRADLREPEAELLDEIEREPVAAGRLRRAQDVSTSTSSPGATGRSNATRGPSQTIALPRSSSQW